MRRFNHPLHGARDTPGQTAGGVLGAQRLFRGWPAVGCRPARFFMRAARGGYNKALVALVLMALTNAAPAVTPPGTVISNTATADYAINGTAANTASNAANITSTVLFTPATVALMQFSPTGADAESMNTSPAACRRGGPGQPFTPLAAPEYPGTGALATDRPLALIGTDIFHQGEPVFIRLTDPNRNLDPALRETVQVTVNSAPGADSESLELTETAADSGAFTGFVQSAPPTSNPHDCRLAVKSGSTIDVDYTDPFDDTDSIRATATVDPFGVVFSSASGAPVDGVTVTLIDAGTGAPAEVFGDDGVSGFPATITTGRTVTDDGGRVYDFSAGRYRFPFVRPGNYRLSVSGDSFNAPSTIGLDALQDLPGAPFALDVNASFGAAFRINAGPPENVDIPVDPLTDGLFLSKEASRDRVALGDFVQYRLELTNTHGAAPAARAVVHDSLPAGFRYQSGSARLNGDNLRDPDIASDGRALEFALGSLPAGEGVTLTYVAEVTAGTPLGRAVNSARAGDAAGETSNEATAEVEVRDELLRSRAFITGRVATGSCAEDGSGDAAGVAGVRLLLEDGRYVISDAHGQYHFAGVQPGTHIVQIDTDSLPANLEVADCAQDSRTAGTPYSRFVETQGGTLWRADFHLRRAPPVEGSIGLALDSAARDSETVAYTVGLTGDTHDYRNLRLTLLLPDGLSYEPGSSTLDGAALADPQATHGALTYRLGGRSAAAWQQTLHLRAHLAPDYRGKLGTQALVTFDTPGTRNQRTPVAGNTLVHTPAQFDNHRYTYRPTFAPLGTRLRPDDRAALDRLIGRLQGTEITRIRVVGHTDNRPIAARSRDRFADNPALSRARARSVADYLRNALALDADRIQISGEGARRQVATNDTAAGRARNRRVELFVESRVRTRPGSLALPRHASGVKTRQVSERAGEDEPQQAAPAPPAAEPAHAQRPADWLEHAGPELAWVAPAPGFNPGIPSLDIGIKHDPRLKVQLSLDGEPVSPLNFKGVTKSEDGTVGYSEWRGVDLKAGDNHFVASTRDGNGETVAKRERTVHYSGPPVRAELVPEQSRLIADGKHPAVVAVRLFDRWGQPVRAGVVGKLEVAPPYQAQQRLDALDHKPLTGQPQGESKYQVGPRGIARIALAPTTQTGQARLRLQVAGTRDAVIEPWLAPARRDWVLVGLAESTVGYNTLSGNAQALDDNGAADDLYQDGRVAFYAKGQVRGKWLLTLAYDSDGDREEDERLRQTIDPDELYTLYGDDTEQRFDAASSSKLYVKLERRQFYALFGDYDTDLSVTELSRYNRSLTGVKTEYNGDRYALKGFAADSDTTFVRDEILGNGTSGLYHLSREDIVINSDKITIEVRDRFHSERVLESRELTRHLDYNIDPIDGTLFFKQPIYRQDAHFNPIYIVAEYEVEAGTGEAYTAGGRGAVKFLDDRLEVGATAIHEGDTGADGELYGADATYALSDATAVHAEVAASDTESKRTREASRSGQAYLAEIVHSGGRVDARAYIRQHDEGFGLGQQRGSESGTRKGGVDGRYRFTDHTAAEGELYRERITTTGARRDVAAARLDYQRDAYGLSAGLRHVNDKRGDGENNESNLVTAGAERRLFDRRLNLRANAEVAVGGAGSIDYPNRLILGADYDLSADTQLFAEHELADGDSIEAHSTRVGIKTKPWRKATVNTALGQRAGENGERLFATLGLTQGMQITEHLSLDFGLDRTQTVRNSSTRRLNPDAPLASGSVDDDYTALSLGADYTRDKWSVASRIEDRSAEQDDQLGVTVGIYREQAPGLNLGFGGQYLNRSSSGSNDATNGDVRFSLSFRPSPNRWTVLDRLDLNYEDSGRGANALRERRVINNTNINWRPDARNQLATHYGVKYTLDSFDGDSYHDIIQTIGSEYRRDLTDRFDAGIQTSALHSVDAGNVRYSAGASLGMNVMKNTWISAGYNVSGFEDNDFTAAGYSAQGPFIKLRVAFDQHSAKDALGLFGDE